MYPDWSQNKDDWGRDSDTVLKLRVRLQVSARTSPIHGVPSYDHLVGRKETYQMNLGHAAKVSSVLA